MLTAPKPYAPGMPTKLLLLIFIPSPKLESSNTVGLAVSIPIPYEFVESISLLYML